MSRVPVARLDDLSVGRCIVVSVERTEVLLVRTADSVHALQAMCSHARSVLGPGRLVGDLIECPMHAALFDPRDGSVQKGPATKSLATYTVIVEDGTVFVDPVLHEVTCGDHR